MARRGIRQPLSPLIQQLDFWSGKVSTMLRLSFKTRRINQLENKKMIRARYKYIKKNYWSGMN
jgi:hypothetical protein